MAPVVPAEVVAALQGGEYETARKALIALGEKAKDRDRRCLLCLSASDRRAACGPARRGPGDIAHGIQASPAGRWAPKIRFELAGIELAAGNWAAAEELTRAEADRLLAGPRKDQLAGVYQAFAQKLLEPDDPLVRPDPNAAYELLAQARELAESPGSARAAPVRDGPRQPDGRQPGPGDRELPAISQGVSRRRRPVRRPVPARRGPAQGQPAPAGPDHLDRPGPRHRTHQAGRAIARICRRSVPTPFTRSPRPSASPIRPTTPA